jgi:hypothetical protein
VELRVTKSQIAFRRQDSSPLWKQVVEPTRLTPRLKSPDNVWTFRDGSAVRFEAYIDNPTMMRALEP